jgi:predicted phage tail protein
LTLPAAKTAPTPATNLTATPASGQASLLWAVPASDGGSAITDYKVEYKLSSDASWTVFNDGISTTNSAVVTGLTNGSSYDFRVSAINAIGNSSPVTITGIAVAGTVTVPDPVTNLAASVDTATHDLKLNWTTPASNGGAAISNYLIEMRLSTDTAWTTVTHAPFNGASFTVTSALTDGATYDVRVTPINSAGNGTPALLSGYVYTTGTGVTGTLTAANGQGTNITVLAPNTGFKELVLGNPAIVGGFGIVTAGLLAFIALRRRIIR